ncbi:MAG: nitroreductase family protein [Bacteroidales bacterium]|nr:nitroreductase family protein [Bacteroidales bacterium]
MQFLEILNRRQSVRAYSDRPVESEKLERCLEAARIAPSACNSQPWKFIVVDDPELKNEIAGYASAGLIPMNRFVVQSPVLVVAVRESANFTSKVGAMLKDKPYTLMDIGMAVLQFCLQATAEGLGTCIIGWFDEKKVKKTLHIPAGKRAELIIAVGYAVENYPLRNKVRKEMAEIRSCNRY